MKKLIFIGLFSVSLFGLTALLGEKAASQGNPHGGASPEASASAESAPMDSLLAQTSFVEKSEKIDDRILEVLPVSNNGRIKPLQSLAKESILFVSGSAGKWGLTPLQTYLGLAISRASIDLEIINIRNVELREKLGFTRSKRFFSLRELEGSRLNEMSQPLIQKEEANAKSLNQDEKDILEAFSQMMVIQQIITGDHLAHAVDASATPSNHPGASGSSLQSKVIATFEALAQNPSGGGDPQASQLVELAKAQPLPELFARQIKNIDLEVFYNHARLFLWSAVLYFLLGAAMFVPRLQKKMSTTGMLGLFALPFLLLVAGFAIRVTITGFAPVTSMYGTMLWVSLGVSAFTMVLFALYRNFVLSGLLWIGTALILLLTESLPLVLNPGMDPIVAVLRSNYWLTIHVLTITISYAAFTVTMVIGNAALITSFRKRDGRAFFAEYAKYAYRMIQLGVFLLTVGIILGGIWADYSWGRFWGWDPKETWALIADVGFIAILHARYAGWLDAFGLLAACPIAYLLVVMAWYGVNFILASGLHSYGFSSGGALAVAVFVSLQVLLLLCAAIVQAKRKGQAASV